jgi:hypothetical protein
MANAEFELIQAVRIISVNVKDDAFTLAYDFFSNTHYFVNILKLVTNSHFIFKDLK